VRYETSRVIARERNVVRVDFKGGPEPPAPRFPGAGALRAAPEADDPGPGDRNTISAFAA
jgi:hypothetical protein